MIQLLVPLWTCLLSQDSPPVEQADVRVLVFSRVHNVDVCLGLTRITNTDGHGKTQEITLPKGCEFRGPQGRYEIQGSGFGPFKTTCEVRSARSVCMGWLEPVTGFVMPSEIYVKLEPESGKRKLWMCLSPAVPSANDDRSSRLPVCFEDSVRLTQLGMVQLIGTVFDEAGVVDTVAIKEAGWYSVSLKGGVAFLRQFQKAR